MSLAATNSPNWPLINGLDIARIRGDFPILKQQVNGQPLIYFDNAASSQVPEMVIQRLERYLRQEHANIHRGVHYLAETATLAYESARSKIAQFINARAAHEIIICSGTTDAINLVMHGYGRKFIQAGDEIILTTLEHHSNIVPWQMLAEEKGACLRIVAINDDGELDLQQFVGLLNPRSKLLALSHVSNALGTITPLKEMIQLAHNHNIPVVVDGAQAIPHLKVDVQELDCDFYAFSGHKLYAPTGVGVLYAKTGLLEKMQPYKGGGDMIASVSFAKTTYNVLPHKFEAGTPPIAAAIGLGAALDYLNQTGLDAIAAYEQQLLQYATYQLSQIPRVKIIGAAAAKVALISFLLEGVHPHDVATFVNLQGIAIRSGHHCAQPLMERLAVPATSRLSLAFYNTFSEIDCLITAIKQVLEVF